jgi:ATP synthase protein I
MLRIAPAAPFVTDEDWAGSDATGDFEIAQLTAEEVQSLRARYPLVSPWRVVGVQALVGGVVALAVWLWFAQASMSWSAGYGALAVVLPAALFARGVLRQRPAIDAGAAMAGFVVWEIVKIALTVAMLVAAPKLVGQLNWLALLAGFVVTMKVHWVAVWLGPVRKNLSKD